MAGWPTLTLEGRLLAQGFVRIAGLDEAGRGAWAGPVVAAAVILPLSGKSSPRSLASLSEQAVEVMIPEELKGIRDSKLLSLRRREALFDAIREKARAVGIGVVGPEEIDARGIVPATRQAMYLALAGLEVAPHYLLIDHLRLPEVNVPQQAMAHGDRLCLSIAAASIIAKVHRDRLMVGLDVRFSGYGLAQHKGYGTTSHRMALARLGPSPIHRLSWVPCRRLGRESVRRMAHQPDSSCV